MESSEKDNGTVCQGPSAQPKRTIKFKPNVLRFRKFYWILGTFGVALAALSLYYMVYVSSQRAYYSERSFRLLGSMGDKLVLDVDLVRNVLAAAASQGRLKAANEYIQWSLHGTLEEQDFVVTSLQNSDKRRFRSHAGLLTLFSPEIPNTPIVRADYREPNPNAPSVRADYTEPKVANPDNFCAKAVTEIVACATVDLSSLVRPAFQELGQDFFQDVLIADSSGQVLYQQWGAGTRVHNLSALFPQPKGGKTDTVSPNRDNSVGPVVAEFSRVSQYSNVVEIDLAGSRYQLFIEPLPVSLHVPGKGSRRLVLCGLRSLKHGESQAMALPHTYLIWAILVVLAAFTLTWPFLKFVYMSSKEKLQTRHVLYFLLSVTVATASVTLIALNFAYKLTENKSSEYEIQQLAHKLNSNIVEELRSALKTVDVLAAKDSRLLPLALDSPVCGETEKTSRWNEAQFLQKHAKLLPKIQRPYFRYFFLADEEGCQRLKVTVNPRTTPQVRINLESYFHPVKDTELSHLPKTDQGTETYDFRMQPLFSSNTGEFLVLLAAPFDAQKDKQLAALRLRVKALAIRFESLFNPVLPLGYGYAVVDPSGRVLFDSISARNLTEDFTKESRADPGLRALLAQGTTGVVDAMYLGTQKKLLVTPVARLSDPRLTLIVYKDSTYFTTLNTAIMVSVIVLLALYALPFWIFVLVHMARNSDYPSTAVSTSLRKRSAATSSPFEYSTSA